METTKNALPPNTKKFFYNLGEYLDTKVLFYGSIQRADYVPGKSDIDVVIFTENEDSLMTKIQHYLHLKKKDFNNVMYIIDENVVYGYKVKYENKGENIKSEFSIYNENYKDIIIKQHKKKFVLPAYISVMLYLLKMFYYKIPILSKSIYINSKNWLLNLVDNPGTQFIVLN